MPVDKFGRMSDTKTTDSGVSLTYINNNYVRSDGGTPLTGSLDVKGNIIYNVAEPVNPQDVVTKVYVDNTKGSGVIGRKIGDAVSIKENMDFMGKQKIKNLPDPVNDHDAATKEYVDTKTELGDIDMEGKFTVLNVKTPINDNHITDKKYVDDNAAFVFRNNEYYAKGNISSVNLLELGTFVRVLHLCVLSRVSRLCASRICASVRLCVCVLSRVCVRLASVRLVSHLCVSSRICASRLASVRLCVCVLSRVCVRLASCLASVRLCASCICASVCVLYLCVCESVVIQRV